MEFLDAVFLILRLVNILSSYIFALYHADYSAQVKV